MNDLVARLTGIGLKSMAQNLDDFIARATKARWSPHSMLEQLCAIESAERSRLSLEHRLGFSGIGRFKPMADFNWDWPKGSTAMSLSAPLRSTSSRRPAT